MEEKKKKQPRLLCSDIITSQNHGKEESISRSSNWEGLNPEILALIFVRLPPDEMSRCVPFVCRSWRQAVAGPYCWTDIDIENWCRRCNQYDAIRCTVRRLVRRSKGNVRSLSAYKLSDYSFSFIANSCGKHLKILRIPVSEVTDMIVTKHASLLSALMVVDISNCLKITSISLKTLGKHCKCLVHLKRNMPPPENVHGRGILDHKVFEDEAMAVADTMPGLLHLELGYGRFSDCGLEAILTKCKALIHLDIQGCWGVKMEGDLEERCEKITYFKSPWDDDEYDGASSSDSDGHSGVDETDSSSD